MADTSHMKKSQQGTLYVVATPIGNLEDITLRAIRVLGEVELVAAEDTRHTRKLLNHLGLSKPLISYYKDRETARTQKIIEELQCGKDVALVSDAGTPAISDPGAILVSACRAQGIQVIPVPGPSAITTVLSVSGLSQTAFTFLGFLPSKKSARRKLLTAHAQDETVTVFYESPRRICRSLTDSREIFGDRQVVIGRELTKLHEEILTGTLSEILEKLQERASLKGEFVVAVAGGETQLPEQPENLDDLLRFYKSQSGVSMKDAVKKISRDLNLSRSQVYKEALSVWDES